MDSIFENLNVNMINQVIFNAMHALDAGISKKQFMFMMLTEESSTPPGYALWEEQNLTKTLIILA